MIAAKAVNHIGIAVRSIAAHREFYERTLGARFDGIEEIPAQKVRVAFFRIGPAGHEVRLELVEATSPDSPVAAFIEKRGEGLHHVAYTVEGIDTILESLKGEGIRLIDEQARDGAHHQRIAFLHPKSSSGVLTELCEPPGLPKES
jgi:methylmalonyl-CoA/ethylmalonyl-CoA epimerase